MASCTASRIWKLHSWNINAFVWLSCISAQLSSMPFHMVYYVFAICHLPFVECVEFQPITTVPRCSLIQCSMLVGRYQLAKPLSAGRWMGKEYKLVNQVKCGFKCHWKMTFTYRTLVRFWVNAQTAWLLFYLMRTYKCSCSMVRHVTSVEFAVVSLLCHLMFSSAAYITH